MKWIHSFISFLKYDLWHVELDSDSRLHRFGVEVLRVTHLVLKGVRDDNCKLHAAALTYATLMALVPFLVMVFSLSSAIGFPYAKQKLLEWSSELGLPDVVAFVEELIEMVESVDLGRLGTLGGILFLFIIFKLLNGIEESFNRIWGVRSSRRLADKFRNYLSVLVSVPVLMILSVYTSSQLTGLTTQYSWVGPFINLIFQIAPVAIMTLAFLCVFLFLPNTKVYFKPALLGAVISAMLFLLLQRLMIKAGIGVTNLNLIYVGFAYVPVFLFWLQMSWMILLFGSELAFAMQHRQTFREERRAGSASGASKLWVSYRVLKETIRVFYAADECQMHVARFAEEANIPIRLINEVIDVLEEGALLKEVVNDDEKGYVLVQAPQQISAKQVFDLMVNCGASPSELGLHDNLVDSLLSRFDQNLEEAMVGLSLDSFSDGR
jgi:membrane protein